MTFIRRTSLAVGLVAAAVVLTACIGTSDPANAPEVKESRKKLKALAKAMKRYEAEAGAFPPDQKTFLEWARKKEPDAVEHAAHYAVCYAPARLEILPNGGNATVLAYEKEPRDTRYYGPHRLAATADGEVTFMQEPDFQGKPKLDDQK